jgi:hypothetical protein
MKGVPRSAFVPRKDWMPQNRAELCACISVLVLDKKLSDEDALYVADWIHFRRSAYSPVVAPQQGGSA